MQGDAASGAHRTRAGNTLRSVNLRVPIAIRSLLDNLWGSDQRQYRSSSFASWPPELFTSPAFDTLGAGPCSLTPCIRHSELLSCCFDQISCRHYGVRGNQLLRRTS